VITGAGAVPVKEEGVEAAGVITHFSSRLKFFLNHLGNIDNPAVA
jgi:hypothetical protein